MFSVVIPHFNRLQSLQQTVSSIPIHRNDICEVIVVDNGSDEAVLNNLRSIYALVDKVHIIECPLGNANTARNTGVNAATGDWIVFCDDDDYFTAEKFDCLAETINSNLKLDVVYNALRISFFGTKYGYITKPKACSGSMLFQNMLINKLGSTSGLTIKKDTLVKVGGFDQSLESLQDYDLYIRLALNSCNLSVIRYPLTVYYKGLSTNQISSGVDRLSASLSYILKKYELNFRRLSQSERLEFENWAARLYASKALEAGNYRTFAAKIKSVGVLRSIIMVSKYLQQLAVKWFYL